ncbi:hypothetical protein AB4Z40_30295 [Bosea sp. 2YAB26]|jgi:hypothetical protein|uniref:hypothetical protein n=1 Tax=unclassified Bosea (in: a-proteobacteria) TaxID=2653178 RepID=UPI003F8E1B0D
MSTVEAQDHEGEDYVSSAFRRENVAIVGSPDEIRRVAAEGVSGAMAVAGLAVAAILVIWFAFFLFIYLPRGAVD